MTIATISNKCFKIYICDAHTSTMVGMFQNKTADQQQVKDAMERSVIWDQKFKKSTSLGQMLHCAQLIYTIEISLANDLSTLSRDAKMDNLW